MPSSPHTRGCFQTPCTVLPGHKVFPAYAGVFLYRGDVKGKRGSLPRIRGGVSLLAELCGDLYWSSPHTRGCFAYHAEKFLRRVVFPAYAGVFRHDNQSMRRESGLPRIRGGVSIPHGFLRKITESSPHTRGCFLPRSSATALSAVFPAYAGVFLKTL